MALCSPATSDFEIVNPDQDVRNTFVDIRRSAEVQGKRPQSDSELCKSYRQAGLHPARGRSPSPYKETFGEKENPGVSTSMDGFDDDGGEVQGKRPQSDSELCKSSRQPGLHPARGQSPSPYKETFGEKDIPGVSTSMDGFDDDGGARRRPRPRRKERHQMRQNMSGEPLNRDDSASTPRTSPSTPWPRWLYLSSLASVAILVFVAKVCFDKQHQLQMAEADRFQREDSQKVKVENQRRHELALRKPAAALLRDARVVIGTSVRWSMGLNLSKLDHVEKADAIISKLDYEKFQVSTGAWKFKCKAFDVERSVRAKLGAQGTQNRSGHLPEVVINNLVISLQTDDEVVEHKRDLVIDGGLGTSTSSQGLMYQYHLRSTVSNGKVSVALMVFSIAFDMKKVVDHFEMQEEPVYDYVLAPKQSTRKCTTRATDGRQCVFPFEYSGERFSRCTTEGSNSLWCATSTYANDKMYNWGFCGPESCKEEETFGPKFVKKFVEMAQKKFPVYSHRALPQGVTQSDLIQALDVVASQEAVRVLSN